jgi:hypothetical protein
MEDCPADCDYGDVKVRITYRILGEEKLTTSERCYRFGPGGKLAAIDAVRPVPRLHDDELRRCLAVGRLDRQAFQALSALDPIDRYMGARSEVGENFIPSNHMLETLRGILHAPCVQDSEPTQAGGHG